jgi:hypothetical protein
VAWRRDHIARLITRLRDLGAATIALDIIFAEPDRDQDVVRVNETLSAAARNAGRPARAKPPARQGGTRARDDIRVRHAVSARCLLHPLNVAIVDAAALRTAGGDDEGPVAPVFRATGSACNLRPLAKRRADLAF